MQKQTAGNFGYCKVLGILRKRAVAILSVLTGVGMIGMMDRILVA